MPTHESRRAKAAGLPLGDDRIAAVAEYLVQLKQQLDRMEARQQRIEERAVRIESGMVKDGRP